ncbi:hypothetical protein OEZ86_006034 [Tetradesmus obliquus]|nr:hypothetical protein OEZ86_006034 [Tetradesmus obliquus]
MRQKRNTSATTATPLALLLLLALLSGTANSQEWQLGRATYFGAPESFSATFDPYRGKGSFGVLSGASCGFTNSDDSIPFPRDQVAALADSRPDYPGSCGRCYAVRCKEGLVLDNDGNPRRIDSFFYLSNVTTTLPDSSGRLWPGNTAEPQGLLYTRCQTPAKELTVRVMDTCPCKQVLPDGAPGVAPGGEIRTQSWCCPSSIGLGHFDLSFWAFEQLAHPLYGIQMLEYRPVDCDTGAPVPSNYISKTDIYQGGTKAGWNWFPYGDSYSKYAVPGLAPDGAAATCVQLAKDGGLSFQVKQGAAEGLQPFGGVTAVQVWLASDARTDDPFETSTPKGQPVDLKVFILNFEFQKYCNAELRTENYTPTATAPGGWYRFTLPFADFKCDYDGALPTQVNRIEFQNTAERNALFCLAGLRLLR